MACGLPVIACRTPGPAAIVADGGTGWLIPPDDEDALVDALVGAVNGEVERRPRGVLPYRAHQAYEIEPPCPLRRFVGYEGRLA
jgi:glycosyltransferase involved in cell wall biosynthesis